MSNFEESIEKSTRPEPFFQYAYGTTDFEKSLSEFNAIKQAICYIGSTGVQLPSMSMPLEGAEQQQSRPLQLGSPERLSRECEQLRHQNNLLDATSGSTSPAALSILARSQSVEIRCAVARNLNTEVSDLSRLAADQDLFVREAVASNRYLGSADLNTLSADSSSRVRNAVAVRLLNYGQSNIHAFGLYDAQTRLANDPQVAATTARELRLIMDLELADSASTAPPTLSRLAENATTIVRATVASNPSTTPLDLDRLSRDSAPLVRSAVVCNPNTPPAAMSRLRSDPADEVRRSLALRTSAADLLTEFSRDRAASVRSAVAANRRTPLEIVSRLCSDPDETVSREAKCARELRKWPPF
ncbi:MAG: hypothetical protein K2W95_25625 [Candidatus Obscuribacterales bacterium]|nr:hypothetical protein [Candidatus Obscuribacterales bacterium]